MDNSLSLAAKVVGSNLDHFNLIFFFVLPAKHGRHIRIMSLLVSSA